MKNFQSTMCGALAVLMVNMPVPSYAKVTLPPGSLEIPVPPLPVPPADPLPALTNLPPANRWTASCDTFYVDDNGQKFGVYTYVTAGLENGTCTINVEVVMDYIEIEGAFMSNILQNTTTTTSSTEACGCKADLQTVYEEHCGAAEETDDPTDVGTCAPKSTGIIPSLSTP